MFQMEVRCSINLLYKDTILYVKIGMNEDTIHIIIMKNQEEEINKKFQIYSHHHPI